MPEITEFQHNGVSLETNRPPESMGPLGPNVVGLVVAAPDRDPSVPLNVPFRISNPTQAQLLDKVGDESGTGWRAVIEILKKAAVPIYVVVVEEGDTEEATTANVVGGVDPVSGQPLGIAALAGCAEVPTIIGAPGFSSEKGVSDALAALARRIYCRFVIDAPDIPVSEMVAFSETLGGEGTGYRRCYVAYQMCEVYSRAAQGNVFVAPSVHAIGCLAAVQPWQSPGNQGVLIQGVARHVDYNILDKSTDGDLLNRYGISYYARTSLGGFSLIGNRTVTGEFISHVGLEDAIGRKIVGASQKAMAQNLTKSFMEQEVRKVDAFVQDQVAAEIIPGGRVYLHPDLNTVERYKNGSWYIVIEYGRYSPNEHMIFHINAVDSIVEEFLEEVL
ncbi:major tail sheath protein [Halomonas phage phiHAP-1]|uniref:Putative tail sheath protein n=1 Tax=Halomonas phage phiHAP-1 (isolate -/Gulf of Mexico/-/2001) TaxID=1283337 RepID=B0ZSG8_BPHA1|nr:major tail sheath protein [Halomonas phage phiHAP-1]ABY90388.1 putative tail sheath protein [Halomonas phage phiHAP-1]